MLLCCCSASLSFFLHFFSQTTRSLVESDDSSVARRRRRSSRKPFVCRRRFNLRRQLFLSSIYFSTAPLSAARAASLSFKNALCAHARFFSPPFITPLAARTPSVSFQTTPRGARLVDPSPIITYWEGDGGSCLPRANVQRSLVRRLRNATGAQRRQPTTFRRSRLRRGSSACVRAQAV